MTNKEVIEQLEWVRNKICNITYSPESFEALNLAIEALEERPQGEWTHIVGFAWWECPFCGMHNEYEKFNFCPNCGADMRGRKNNG